MGKALVIKNVDFGTNKLTTVTLIEPKPCTALSLDKDSQTMTAVGSTFTLTATTTPLDTTESVTWITSNANIATVASGVVTQVGVGSCTITALCGTQSATCAITAMNILTYDYKLQSQACHFESTGNVKDFCYLTTYSVSTNYAGLYNTTSGTTYPIYNGTDGAVTGPIYPIKLGNNATTITATVPNTIRLTIWFVDCDTICNYGTEHSGYNFAKYISGDASVYDSSVALGNRTATIPTGANAAVFTLQKPGSGAAVSAEDIASITIAVS